MKAYAYQYSKNQAILDKYKFYGISYRKAGPL
jgi:hypothetical protein